MKTFFEKNIMLEISSYQISVNHGWLLVCIECSHLFKAVIRNAMYMDRCRRYAFVSRKRIECEISIERNATVFH